MASARVFSKSTVVLDVPEAAYAAADDAQLETWSEKAEEIEDAMLEAGKAKLEELGLPWELSIQQ